jgi:FtsH-binding integral membrane protein
VYQALAMAVACAALGTLAHLKLHVGSQWWAIALIGIIFALHSTPNSPNSQTKRNGLLAGFGFVQGLVVGPLVQAVLDIDPAIVVTAFVASVAVFACFSLAAIYSERRSMLFLGGFLGSALSLMCLAGFVNMFARSEMLFNVQLYGGLLMFIGYVCFDTQLIIERAAQGSFDVQLHALDLFIDFAAIFVRILILLSKNKKRDDNTKRR